MTQPHARWPAQIIDPHIHQWDPFTTPRHSSQKARQLRWLPRVPRLVRWVLPTSDAQFVGNPHHLVKPYLPADYRADAGGVPVGAVVHIEAAWVTDVPMGTVEETRWVSALPFGRAGAPQLGAIVVHADPRWPSVAEVLDAHLAASPLVRGVRCSAPQHPDPKVRDFNTPGALCDPGFLRGFAAVAERGLSFELWLYSHQLRDACVLVAEYPEVTFVLDHYATPVGLFGPRGSTTGRTDRQRQDILAAWREDIAALAAYPNVVAKHSGLGMPVLGGEQRIPITTATLGRVVERAAPLIRGLHDAFGPRRTMWASNYPIDKPGHTIAASLQLITEVLGSDADLTNLLRDVARRTYRLA